MNSRFVWLTYTCFYGMDAPFYLKNANQRTGLIYFTINTISCKPSENQQKLMKTNNFSITQQSTSSKYTVINTMANSIEQPFQRFHISDDDIESSSSFPGASGGDSIPILTRSKEAKSQSLKLQQISPVCVIVVGMAGSGKTTLMAALQRSLNIGTNDNESEKDSQVVGKTGEREEAQGENSDEGKHPPDGDDSVKGPIGYCLNLDPATKLVPFGASIDIRDTVDYKVGDRSIFFAYYSMFQCSEKFTL